MVRRKYLPRYRIKSVEKKIYSSVSRLRTVLRRDYFSSFSFSSTFPARKIKPGEVSDGFTEEKYTYAFAKHVKQSTGRRTSKQEYKTTRMEAKSIPCNCRTRPWSISKRVLRLFPHLYRADKEKN